MKNLKIGTKLLITFMLIILLFCGTVATAIMGLEQNAERYSEFYTVGYRVTDTVMTMRRGLQCIVKDISYITIEDDEEKIDSYEAELQKELSNLEENANWLFANFTDNPELLNTFAEDMTNAVEMQETIITIAHTDHEKAQEMLLDEYQPLVDEAASMLIQISSIVEHNAEVDYQSTVAMQQMLVKLQIGMAGIALVITLILSTYLTRNITRPLRELEKAANQIVDGDFDIVVTYKSRDELGHLSKTFQHMTDMLNVVISDASMVLGEMADGNFDVRTQAEERYVGSFQSLLTSIRKLNRNLSITLGQINQSADLVASDSSQVSNGAQALSQGATEQASAIEQLAATIASLSNEVKATAANAIEARNQSNTAGNEVEECNGQMKDMMTAMEEITLTSNKIGQIIKTIEDISFQTNILALNAAVEASRAGAAGKGFAVVADEVRTLASKSSVASKDTAELIESSIKAVARGTQIADSTAESLSKVVDEVRTASAKVDVIADAAEKQASAIEQVTLGVDQISNVVQTNSATAVESANASHELSDQASILKNLVAKFILREEYIKANTNQSAERYDDYPSNHIDLD